MRRQCARILLAALAAWGLLGLNSGSAQTKTPTPSAAPAAPVAAPVVTPEQRFQQLEQQNQVLQKQLETQKQQLDQLIKSVKEQPASPTSAENASVPPGSATDQAIQDAVQKAVQSQIGTGGPGSYLAAAPTPPATASKDWYQVGSDLKMSAKWWDGLYLQTANKDFWVHFGGWVQNDWVWWDQHNAIRTLPGAAIKGKGQPAPGGVGPETDGDFWRRLRLQFEGGFWEVCEFNLCPAFENNQFDQIGLDEFWVGLTKIPLVGSARFGHVKVAQSLEGDAYSSSRCMTFLERAPMSDAFNQNFMNGLWLFNSFADSRIFYGANIGRQDTGNNNSSGSGDNFGDGQYTYVGRIAALPWYSNEGRCLVHVAASYAWRKAQTGFDANGNPTEVDVVQLRARPGIRDTDAAGFTGVDVTGNQLGGNKNRLVDTGALTCNSSSVVGTEFMTVLGPLSFQAEYEWCTVDNVTAINGGAVAPSNYTFSGGYAMISYFLTGENRSYDKRVGRLDSFYLGRKGPNTPFWLVRNADGKLDLGLGAVEIAGRWSYLDLNDGAIHGGKMDQWEAAVNWYLNNNLKFQFEYVWADRYSVPAGVIPGAVNALGMRMQFVW